MQTFRDSVQREHEEHRHASRGPRNELKTRNDVVESDIRSTDTRGYTEASFRSTRLLGFSYAPRIEKLKRQELNIFDIHRDVDRALWKIAPAGYIGVVVDPLDRFIRSVLGKIQEWLATPKALEAASRGATRVFRRSMRQRGILDGVAERGEKVRDGSSV